MLRETTSRGLCELVCPSRTSEHGGEGYCVKECCTVCVYCVVVVCVALCVFITAVPITKLFARGGGGGMKDMCYERLRAEADVN